MQVYIYIYTCKNFRLYTQSGTTAQTRARGPEFARRAELEGSETLMSALGVAGRAQIESILDPLCESCEVGGARVARRE